MRSSTRSKCDSPSPECGGDGVVADAEALADRDGGVAGLVELDGVGGDGGRDLDLRAERDVCSAEVCLDGLDVESVLFRQVGEGAACEIRSCDRVDLIRLGLAVLAWWPWLIWRRGTLAGLMGQESL